MIIDEELAAKVLETVDAGLIQGMGTPVPGHMCVEAAVCYAMGLPHGDEPTCVGSAVRDYKIRINDAMWSSKEARAAGLRRVAIAQLGSVDIDQIAFAAEVTIQAIRQVLPKTLRERGMEQEAVVCENATDLPSAKNAAHAAQHAFGTSYNAIANAAYTAAFYATKVALDLGSVTRAPLDPDYNLIYSNNVVARAAAEVSTRSSRVLEDNTDKILTQGAEIAVQALIGLRSPGCQFLYLCDK